MNTFTICLVELIFRSIVPYDIEVCVMAKFKFDRFCKANGLLKNVRKSTFILMLNLLLQEIMIFLLWICHDQAGGV